MTREVVIFTSPTCGPCRQVKPALMGLAVMHGFACEAIEASQSTQPTFVEFGVRQVPTVVVLEGGKEVSRFVGAKTTPLIEEFLVKAGVIR